MIINKNDGTQVIDIDIIIFKPKVIEAWVNGVDCSILIPMQNVSAILPNKKGVRYIL